MRAVCVVNHKNIPSKSETEFIVNSEYTGQATLKESVIGTVILKFLLKICVHYTYSSSLLVYIVLIMSHSAAKDIWRQDLYLKSYSKDWRSRDRTHDPWFTTTVA